MIKYSTSNFYKFIFSGYKRQLETHPLRTKMATSACLFGLGDYLCQQLETATLLKHDEFNTCQSAMADEGGKNSWNVQRSVRQGAIGGLLLSPGLHFFLTRVMARCVATFPSFSRGVSGIGLRVALHQACMMPYIQFSLLFVSGMLMPGCPGQATNLTLTERIDAGKTRFNDKWKLGFSASLCYWPLVNAVMYSLVQPRFMNLYADVATLVFASIMSYITYSDFSTIQPTAAVLESQMQMANSEGEKLKMLTAQISVSD